MRNTGERGVDLKSPLETESTRSMQKSWLGTTYERQVYKSQRIKRLYQI